ncbi:hypothetical protein BDV30DRAFT_231973 [Aspergillus minisclerotigenes]|uniref:Uncharacterized protein n=1 Tax=Aspergillus minisclerotigenes TaxID=656917 RepID=A0A5N6IJS8_9EURO|nr:hypothetical protein BDV30DRAFT_231973 [Aspergillus minisclerotigenes]
MSAVLLLVDDGRGKKRTKTPSTSKTPLKTLKSSFLFVVPWGRNKSWNGQGRQRRQAPITPQTGALNLGWAAKLGKIWRQDLYDILPITKIRIYQ